MTNVECYAGSTYPESPRALEWEGLRYIVETILERRREPHGVGFLVRCTPEHCADDTVHLNLFYQFEEEQWQIRFEGSPIENK